MQTERAYYDHRGSDPASAQILEIRPWKDKRAVILDRTIFYPEGGGQSADRGTINGYSVLDVREEGEEILHILSADDGVVLRPGAAELTLDVPRRRDFTTAHTSQHLLSGIILARTGKPTVSMHLGDEICTVDVDTPEFPSGTITAVEDAVAAAIEEDHPVIIHLCPPEDVKSFPLRKVPPQGEEVIRVVEIQGYDFSPCCGTHLKSTGQIGMMRILSAEKYKGMTRISFIAGHRVLENSRLLMYNADIVSRALSVPLGETGEGVLALLEKNARLERRLKTLEEESALRRAKDLLGEAGLTGDVSGGEGKKLVKLFTEMDMEELMRIGKAAQQLSAVIVVLASESEKKFAAFCSQKTADVRTIVKGPLEAHGGRGGGSPSFFQGLFPDVEKLRSFMAAL
ncbi:alanyl-tRNA editing protein [Spirochaetia bacterium]|nr:alanyl-tRNA editing protein [Spirochaetia bacterium]